MKLTENTTNSEMTTPIAPATTSNAQVVVEELLIEEISIDGMCGVY
jgi:mycofactocin precursor